MWSSTRNKSRNIVFGASINHESLKKFEGHSRTARNNPIIYLKLIKNPKHGSIYKKNSEITNVHLVRISLLIGGINCVSFFGEILTDSISSYVTGCELFLASSHWVIQIVNLYPKMPLKRLN